MARQLWLLRHAEAVPHGAAEDHVRDLTARGEAQARTAGAALSLLEGCFEAVLYSPKVRARRTAELAAESWSAEQRALLTEHRPLAGGFSAAEALDAAAGLSADGRLLLVGHEPDLSLIVADLTGGRPDVKKGGLAVVRLEGSRGELAVLMRPRDLALVAGVPIGRE
jgi:phosphohistidine phosphatase